MKKLVPLIFFFTTVSSAAQVKEKCPFYNNSFCLEFMSPIAYGAEVLHRTSYKATKLPSTFLSLEFRISNKFYGETGLKWGADNVTVTVFTEDTLHKEYAATFFAGILLKQKLFKNFYFTPSFDFYYSVDKWYHNDIVEENSSYYTAGPTIGFEYFFSKRFSLNTDLLNINWGIRTGTLSNAVGNSSYNVATIYKVISLGFHYNFDWKKQEALPAE